jgi:hypothetical protein
MVPHEAHQLFVVEVDGRRRVPRELQTKFGTKLRRRHLPRHRPSEESGVQSCELHALKVEQVSGDVEKLNLCPKSAANLECRMTASGS